MITSKEQWLFRVQTAQELAALVRRIPCEDLPSIVTEEKPWGATRRLCRNCHEWQANDLCEYCQILSDADNLSDANTALMIFTRLPATLIDPWPEIANCCTVAIDEHRRLCLCYRNDLLQLLQRLFALVQSTKAVGIAVFALTNSRYTTGDALAVIDHHRRYFPRVDGVTIKFFPSSSHLASLDYAMEKLFFLDEELCRQLLGKALEIKTILSREIIGILRKSLREDPSNRAYMHSKLLYLCTKRQQKHLDDLQLGEMERRQGIFLLELTEYV